VAATAFLADFPAASRLVPWIEGAYLRVYAAAFVVVVAALLRDLARTPRQGYAVAALGAALLLAPVALRHRVDRVVPTDAREALLARSWRALVPPDATVVWLAQVESATLGLPLYHQADPDRRAVIALDRQRLARFFDEPQATDTWYYRSSLCSTPGGADACAAFEARHPMTLVRGWTLPAIESYSTPYVTRAVRVGLYRVAPAPAPAPGDAQPPARSR
jgi:hypothetical protein